MGKDDLRYKPEKPGGISRSKTKFVDDELDPGRHKVKVNKFNPGVYKFKVNYFTPGVTEVVKKKGAIIYKVSLGEVIYKVT